MLEIYAIRNWSSWGISKLFLNKRDIIHLQVRFLDQKSSNEENLLFSSTWDENGITDAQMAAKPCLPVTLKNKCNWSLCSAAIGTKGNCHKNYVQLPKLRTKPHNRTQDPGSEQQKGGRGSRRGSVPELWDWRPIYCLLCPRGRWLCRCSETLVPQLPLMGGRRVKVLHWIQPPVSSWCTTWPQQLLVPPRLFLELTPTAHGLPSQLFRGKVTHPMCFLP